MRRQLQPMWPAGALDRHLRAPLHCPVSLSKLRPLVLSGSLAMVFHLALLLLMPQPLHRGDRHYRHKRGGK